MRFWLLAFLLLASPAFAQSSFFPGRNNRYSTSSQSPGSVQVEPLGASISSTLAALFGRQLSVLDFGAVCDGVTDDGIALGAATAYASSHNVTISLPAGTCVTGRSITIYSSMGLVGQGKNQTTIKLADNSCADVLLGKDFYSLTGTNSSGGIQKYLLQGFTIQGNHANQSGCADKDAVNGIAQYGRSFIWRDLYITGVVGHGIRTEWYQYGEEAMEAFVENVTTDNVGRNGVWWKGPHDSVVLKLITLDSSQEADETYNGLKIEGYGSSNFSNFHGWHRSTATNRVAFQASSIGGDTFVDSQFEGGRQEFNQVTGTTSCEGCKFFAGYGTSAQALVRVDGGQFLFYPNTTQFTCTDGGGLQGYGQTISYLDTVAFPHSGDFPCISGTNPQAIDLQQQHFNSAQTASGQGSCTIAGLGNSAQGQGSCVAGGNQNELLGANSFSGGGSFGYDAGESAMVWANGRFAANGDAQFRLEVLRCTTSNTSTCRLTTDQAAAGSRADTPPNANCLNFLLMPSAMQVQINLIATDHSALTNSYAWNLANGLLITTGSTVSTAVWSAGTPGTLTHGTTTGIAVTASADTTNGCLSLVFTPPSANSHKWNVVAVAKVVETQ